MGKTGTEWAGLAPYYVQLAGAFLSVPYRKISLADSMPVFGHALNDHCDRLNRKTTDVVPPPPMAVANVLTSS